MPARRAFYLASVTSYSGFALNLIGTIILARLLTPAEIGTFSIAASLATLVAAFRDLGVGNYVVQEQELTADRIRAAFAVALGLSWTFGIVLAVVSFWIGDFYGNPALVPLVLLNAFNFLLIPFGSITVAVLRRELEFGKLLVINLGSGVIGTATSIILAARGWSSLGLALGSTVGIVATVLLAQLFRPRGLPLLPGVRELRRVLRFGFAVTAGSAAGSATEASSDLIIGKMLGAVETGLFNKGVGLSEGFAKIILQPVWSFALPHFAEQIRSGADIAPVYLRAVSLLCGIAVPFLAVVAITASALVDLLLGPQWTAAVPVAQITCLGMMLGIVIAPFGSLLLAKSLTGDYVRFMLLGLAVKVAVLIAMAPFGLVVVAIAYSLSGTVIVLTALTVLKRRLGIGFRAHMRAVASSVLIAAIVAGCVFATWSLILKAGWTNLTNLALIAPFSVACWVGASWRLHAPLRQEIDLLRRRALRMRWGV